MTTVTAIKTHAGLSVTELNRLAPGNRNNVTVHGMLHSVRDMGGFAFLVLRKADGLVQCVYDKTGGPEERELLREESAVVVTGDVSDEPRAPGGIELHVKQLEVLSAPAAELPFSLGKKGLNISLEHEIGLRPVTLRHQRKRSVFQLQSALTRAFRAYLEERHFTEIFSPKIVSAGAEGGANIFQLAYFGQKAYLAQSPQFYKQMMIPVYERVFEIAPVFRAEKHDTPRHLNEYISVDLEMGFIQDFTDIMEMETGMLRYAFDYLKEHCAPQLAALQITLPQVDEIPCLRFIEAKERVAEKYNRKIKDPYDLEPEEERLISQLATEEYGSEFVFVTHYPVKKRPFYAMDDPEDPKSTLSFDLLFRGLEITTGGQRIHDYDAQVEKMRSKGLDPREFDTYLMLHKYGCPPHGGLGMGLERLLMKLSNESNIRATSMFPRDTTRLNP